MPLVKIGRIYTYVQKVLGYLRIFEDGLCKKFELRCFNPFSLTKNIRYFREIFKIHVYLSKPFSCETKFEKD